MSKWNGIANPSHIFRKIYECWRDVKIRCYNDKSKSFLNYGFRGITMCDEWLNDFLSFYNWSIDNGWKESLHLDRKDNDGNYCPENCQFITKSENNAVGKKRIYKSNKSGYIGILFRKNRYNSYISINKKQIYLGSFKIIKDALQARIDAEILYFGEQKTNFKQE